MSDVIQYEFDVVPTHTSAGIKYSPAQVLVALNEAGSEGWQMSGVDEQAIYLMRVKDPSKKAVSIGFR